MATTTNVRLFEVPPHVDGKAADAVELEPFKVNGDSDQAKRAAREELRRQGFLVRSLNWAPAQHGGNELVAYVPKKGT